MLTRVARAWIAGAGVVALAACGGGGERAARVNRDEISTDQVTQVLQQRHVRPDQADAAGRQVLERLIDQQLVLQKADDLRLADDPAVRLQIELARREVLARAYADKVAQGAARPTEDDMRRYYASRPALFAERRLYSLQELVVESRPDQIGPLRDRIAQAQNMAEVVEYLKSADLRYVANQAVRAAEQLPLQNLDAIARMRDGQVTLVPTATGLTVLMLVSSRQQPVTFEQARSAIESYLINERKRSAVEDDLKALRAAATIEYGAKYAPSASAPAPGAAASRP